MHKHLLHENIEKYANHTEIFKETQQKQMHVYLLFIMLLSGTMHFKLNIATYFNPQ